MVSTGYSAPGVEKVLHQVFDAEEIAKQRAAATDVKENFECGREDDQLQPNVWLPDVVFPGFKEACLDFYWVCVTFHVSPLSDFLLTTMQACRETELDVFRALAVGLRIPEDYFTKAHQNADNQLRLLHYPR